MHRKHPRGKSLKQKLQRGLFKVLVTETLQDTKFTMSKAELKVRRKINCQLVGDVYLVENCLVRQTIHRNKLVACLYRYSPGPNLRMLANGTLIAVALAVGLVGWYMGVDGAPYSV